MVVAFVFVKQFKALLVQTSACINQQKKRNFFVSRFQCKQKHGKKSSVKTGQKRAHKHMVADGMDGALRVSGTFRGFNNIKDRNVEWVWRINRQTKFK